MQWSHATLVQRVRVRACFDQICDHVTLGIPIPMLRARTPVCGVVERFSSPSVASANVGASRDERVGEFSLMRGSSDMQRRVTAVDVVMDRSKAIRLGVLAARSAFYNADVIAALLRHGSHFSITARQDRAVRKAIATIEADAWTAIKYTNAIYDEDQQRWISDVEVAEVAFTSRAKAKHITARLIVRRVKDLNPANQGELFTAYRYHAVFTDSPQPMIAAEAAHRAHAIVEQVIADLKNGALAHLPQAGSGPTAHGWSAPRWRSTSPAPPGSWRRPFMPRRGPARSARS
jgi:hypothetical protein